MKNWRAWAFPVLLFVLFALPVEGADKIRVGILKFESKADGVSGRQAEIITDIFTRELASSRSIAVYEREQLEKVGAEIRLGMSGLVDTATAVQVGKIAGVQYVLMGAVTNLSNKVSGGAGYVPLPVPVVGGIGVGGGAKRATATIDMRVVDTTTGEVTLALSETGSSVNTASGIVVSGFAAAEAEFGGLEARAIGDAVTRLAHEVRGILGNESSYVIAVSGSDYTIDVGSTMGAKEGALYLVYADGPTVKGMDGSVLGREKIPLAVLKVRSVSSAHSVCSLAPGCSGKLIERGDKIEPVAIGSTKNMKFATSRPAVQKSSETYDALFGKDKKQ